MHPWCGHCRRRASLLDELVKELPGLHPELKRIQHAHQQAHAASTSSSEWQLEELPCLPRTAGLCSLARAKPVLPASRMSRISSTLHMATHNATGVSCPGRLFGAAEEGGCIRGLVRRNECSNLVIVVFQYVNPCPSQLCLITSFGSVWALNLRVNFWVLQDVHPADVQLGVS